MSKHYALIFSDWHLHTYKQHNANGSRLSASKEVLNDIGIICDKYGITTIFFGGDLYDQQQVIPTEVVNETVDAFVSFAENHPSVTIYAISGNHDHATKNMVSKAAVTALTHIARIIPSNFVLIDDRSVLIAEGITVSGIPYYEQPDQFSHRLQERVKWVGSECMERTDGDPEEGAFTSNNYLLIHQTPKGIGNEMIPFDCNPADRRFSYFQHVFCGHIHKRQQLGDNFTVVGSPIHRDKGDMGEQKGVLIMNLHKPEKGYKFFYLKNYPEFRDEGGEAEVRDIDFVVESVVEEAEAEVMDTANADSFRTDLSSSVLLENYWKEVGDDNEELLKTGLSFIGIND